MKRFVLALILLGTLDVSLASANEPYLTGGKTSFSIAGKYAYFLYGSLNAEEKESLRAYKGGIVKTKKNSFASCWVNFIYSEETENHIKAHIESSKCQIKVPKPEFEPVPETDEIDE